MRQKPSDRHKPPEIVPPPSSARIKIAGMIMNVSWVRRNGKWRAKVKMTKDDDE